MEVFPLMLVLCLSFQLSFGQNENVPYLSRHREKRNVILFLGETTPNATYTEDGGLKLLGMKFQREIKPCSSNLQESLPLQFRKFIRYDPKICECEKRLDSSLMSLIGWAHNAMGMTTALISMEDLSTSGDKVTRKTLDPRYFKYVLNSSAITDGQLTTTKEKLNENKITDTLPQLEKISELKKHNLPLYNDYSEPQNFKSNDIKKHALEPSMAKTDRIKRLVEPENTEVFEIKTKPKVEKPLEISHYKDVSKPETIWDLLGLMSAIRSSFFSNFVGPSLDPTKRMIDEENGLNLRMLGEKQEPSLLDLVRNTLRLVQADSATNSDNGYLIIVMGGNLSEIGSAYSDFVQTIKYVTENTQSNNTLIVVSGQCPRGSGDMRRAAMKGDLPLYAKGPHSFQFLKAKELYDVPLYMRSAIKRMSKHTLDEDIFSSLINLKREVRHIKAKRAVRNVHNESVKLLVNEIALLIVIIFVVFV